MQKKPTMMFFPGRKRVVFRKGPRGFLVCDPTPEAQRIKDNPALKDQSAPLREDLVRQNALAEVRRRGGDASDRLEVQGDYVLQFGKYKGQVFRWLLENDVGYILYLFDSLTKEEEAGIHGGEGHGKVNLHTFLRYARSYQEIEARLAYEAAQPQAAQPQAADAAPLSDHDRLVGFGKRPKSTWGEVWESRADGYASFILSQHCTKGTKMDKLQQYLRRRQQETATAPVMDEDEDLERAMLTISPSKCSARSRTCISAVCTSGVIKDRF
ncbi:uncharacterized protein LOC134460571 [Engraulis encrasicolus]|uniref:uncharacterized protein LOC134460571 n=1 Tax=Engraulis encrasicolus TaxID=184585 RepID=UPI002FD3733B